MAHAAWRSSWLPAPRASARELPPESFRPRARRLRADGPELLHALAAVLGHVHVALRVDGDAVRLIELAGIVPEAAEARQDPARRALDDLDARVVLVDDEHQPL